jgi:S1-C subfamily serine protease
MDELPVKTRTWTLSPATERRATAILRFLQHNSKELIIAFVLAVVAAVLIDVYREHSQEQILKSNRAAVAELFAYNAKGEPLGTGSGLFIHPDGTLITNFHVVEGASKIEAKLPSGAFYKMKSIRGSSKDRDIAILQFDAEVTPAVREFGDSDSIEVGQRVVTIGSPLGLNVTVSDGIISNPKLRMGRWDFIQFTAPISPGSSGGGLFDTSGRVIGLTSASLNIHEGEQEGSAQNLNVAIPVNVVKDALDGKDKTLSDESPYYYYILGNIAEDKRDFHGALENYQRAVMLAESSHNPFAGAYLGLGGAYYELGNYDLEVANYRKATECDPENSDGWYYLATAFEDTGQYDKAIDAYQKSLELDPDNKETLHDLGLLFLATGKKDKAATLASKLMALDPGLAKKLKLLLEGHR